MSELTTQEPTLPDDLNPVVVDALAKLIGKVTGLVPPAANYFPPEWHGALRDFYRTCGDIAAANIAPAESNVDADGQQNFFGVAPGAPMPNYIDLQDLREKLLAPREIVRDNDGWLVHPAYPICDEGVRADKFLEAFGIESSFVAMDGDANQALVDRYFEDGDANCLDWTPTPPEGDDWMLLEIYDTEDGPYALFGRRKVDETNRERRARENAEAASVAQVAPQAWLDVTAERQRQITEKGHTLEDDAIYNDQGQMSWAAAGLAVLASEAATDIVLGLTGGLTYADQCIGTPEPWPHDWKYKPATPRRNLVVAGAFILAEIERIDLIAAAPAGVDK